MSDNLPFEIRVEIMKRLPVKSLLQFRSVSKAWKNLIDSPEFIAHYRGQEQHLLVAYEGVGDDDPNYVSILDDKTFPQQKVSPSVPMLLNMLNLSILNVIGCSHGLLCLHGVYLKSRGDSISKTENVAVLWNPSIRRAIAVVVPNVLYRMYETHFGFGVCPVTVDPKIVKITQISRRSNIETISSIPCPVEVFTLSTGVWRPSYGSNLPRKSISFDLWLLVVAHGFLYWFAKDRITMDGGDSSYYLIISFDITTEEFGEVNLPHSLEHDSRSNLYMSKLRESLVVLQRIEEAENPVIIVWMMEDGVPKLFTKLFTFNAYSPDARINTSPPRVRGFRKSGELIIEFSEIPEDELPILELFVYDPNSKQFDHLGVSGIASTFLVHPYIETLLLLDQPNVASYNEMETIRFLDDLAS